MLPQEGAKEQCTNKREWLSTGGKENTLFWRIGKICRESHFNKMVAISCMNYFAGVVVLFSAVVLLLRRFCLL